MIKEEVLMINTNIMRGHRLVKGISAAILGAVLAFVLLISNFGGVFTTKVYADNTSVEVDSGYALESALSNASQDPDNPTIIILKNSIDQLVTYNLPNGRYAKLNLNGKTLRATEIGVYGNLTVFGTGEITTDSSNICVIGEFILQEGTITCLSSQASGISGRFIMSGGNFNGDVFSFSSNASFEMKGGTFNGSINTSAGGTFTQTGGYNSGVNKTITLMAIGGSPATSTVTTVTVSGVEKLYSLPPAPTAPSANHTFDGWFTAPDGGDLVTTDTVFSDDSYIYAHWTVTSTPATNTSTTSNSVTSSPSNTNISGGTLTPENPSADVTKDYLDELTEQLEEAIKAGGPQTIYWNEGTALPGPVMKMLEENPEITIVFSYTYEGLDYVVTIPGKNVKYDPNVPWCGPLYLYGLYGKYGTTTVPVATTTQAGERSYTVISGETLWGIAMRLGTTVEELVRLNNITNPDRIDIGQIIRY